MSFPPNNPLPGSGDARGPEEARSPVERLFLDHGQMVFRVCLRYTKSREEAEDLMQDVFLKLQEGHSRFRGEASVFTWIYRVAVNQCLDHLRSRKSELDRCVRYVDETLSESLSDRSEPTLARLSLERILENQNPEARQILFLYHAERLSQEEIAEVLRISRGAVAKKLAKAMAEVQKRARLFTQSEEGPLFQRLKNRWQVSKATPSKP